MIVTKCYLSTLEIVSNTFCWLLKGNRDQLANFSEHMLSDIGMHRVDALEESLSVARSIYLTDDDSGLDQDCNKLDFS